MKNTKYKLMKSEKTNDFLRSVTFIIVGLLISMLLVTIFSVAVTDISATMTYDTTMSVKKNMLYEYVNNMILYIDREKEEYTLEHPEATEEEVEEAMTALARKRIYGEEHSDGAYMWIQKVLDYNGGDGYAIRLIHRNLSDTEGSLLSTNEVNQMGMKAYEIELNGIRSDGEIYQNYAFKKLNSDEVTEKVTYAKLYKPFDWIICMGVNLDDIEHYRLQSQENMRSYQTMILIAIAVTWLFMLFMLFFLYRKAGLREFEKKNKELRNKLNRDVLTGASSRSYGEKLLHNEFEAFREGKRNTLIGMMDVDFFKQFNDGFGHEVGDQVLRSFVTAVRDCTRSTDSIIRWGGDEFVVILQSVPRNTMGSIADKILESIRAIRLEGLDESVRITSSMGFTYFSDSDTDYKSTLARADEGLYKAKEAGRNNWKMDQGDGVPGPLSE